MSDDERKILIEFYNAANGPEWKYSTDWCSKEPLSQWYGVSVQGGHVILLNLGGNGLRGMHCYILLQYIGVDETLPGTSLTAFFCNIFTIGHIPQSLCNLQSLIKLSLYSNELTGNLQFI